VLKIPEVTLLMLADVDIPEAVYAVNKSCESIEWGAVKFLGSKGRPEGLCDQAQYEKTYPIQSIASLFILTVLLFDLGYGIIRGYNTTTSVPRGETIQPPISTPGVRVSGLGMGDFPYVPESYYKFPRV